MEGRAQKKGKYAGGVEAASEDKGKEWRGKEEGGGRVQRKSSSALWKENGGSLAWAGVWMGVGHLLRGSGPKVGKTPIYQDFLSLSWHHRVYVLLPHLSQAGQEHPELRVQERWGVTLPFSSLPHQHLAQCWRITNLSKCAINYKTIKRFC